MLPMDADADADDEPFIVLGLGSGGCRLFPQISKPRSGEVTTLRTFGPVLAVLASLYESHWPERVGIRTRMDPSKTTIPCPGARV